MKQTHKSPWRKIISLSALTLITLSLTACAQTTPNIAPNPSYMADDDTEGRGDDFYTVAYGNMINLDAAVKYEMGSVIYEVSRIQLMYGDYVSALKTIDRGLEFSNDLRLVINKIKLLERLSDVEARDALVQSVITEQSNNYSNMSLDDKLNYNFLLISNNENEQAIQNYFEIIESNVGIGNEYLNGIYNNIGWAYLNLSDFENAKIYCNLALEYDPEDSLALSNLGNSYYGLDEMQSAFEVYEKSMQLDPTNTYAVFGYASSAQDLEKYDLAIDTWNLYLEGLPMDIDGWNGLYQCYLSTEDLEGQAQCLEMLISLVPDNRSYAYDHLVVQQEIGNSIDPYEMTANYRAAVGDFEANRLFADFSYNYVSKDQGSSLYNAMLSSALSYSEYAALAEDVYYFEDDTLFAHILNVTEETLSREERLKIEAYLYYYDENPETLLAVASEIVAINPESGYGYEYLGDAFYFSNDYARAATTYSLAATYREDPYYALHAQVDCLILLSRLEEAEALNAQLLELYPDDAYSYVYQARIAMKMGTTEAAVDQLITAMSLSDYLDGILDTYEELSPLSGRPELKSIGQ